MKFLSLCSIFIASGAMLYPFAAAADCPAGSEASGNTRTETTFLTASPVARQGEPNNAAAFSLPRVHLRLGAVLSPEANFAGGLDIAVPNVRLSRDFAGRVDIETFVVNFKNRPSNVFVGNGTASGTSVYLPITLNQVYVKGLRNGGKVYGGFGVGGVIDFNIFTEAPGFLTGKLFLGAQLNSRTGAELGVHFIGSDTLATLQVRFGL